MIVKVYLRRRSLETRSPAIEGPLLRARSSRFRRSSAILPISANPLEVDCSTWLA